MANFTSLIVNVQWKYTQLNATYCHDNATLDATLVNTCYKLTGLEMSHTSYTLRISHQLVSRAQNSWQNRNKVQDCHTKCHTIATQNATDWAHLYTLDACLILIYFTMHQEYFAVIQNTNVFRQPFYLICDLSTRNENVYSGILNDLQGTPCVSSVYFLSVERYNPYATIVNCFYIPLVQHKYILLRRLVYTH